MRKWLSLLAGACCLIASSAHAAKVWTGDRITWRTSCLACGNGYADTSIFRPTVTADAGTLQQDTTAAISMSEWGLPPAPAGGVADTASYFTFAVMRSKETSLTEGEDSLYVRAQVSLNGSDWHSDSLSFAGVGVSVTNPTSASIWSRIREDGTSGSFHANAFIQNGGVGGIQVQVPNRGALNYMTYHGWPLVRFIVGHSNSMTGEYEGQVYHWKESPEKYVRWDIDPVMWRTSSTAFAQLYMDSSVTSYGQMSATTDPATHTDTTAVIPINEWSIPNLLTGAAADTMTAWAFYLARTNVTTSAAYAEDSLAIIVQYSNDGSNWLRDAGSTTVAALSAPQLTTGTYFDGTIAVTPLLENGATGSFTCASGIPTGGVGGIRVGPTNFTTGVIGLNQWFGAPYIRFIISGDMVGQYRGYFGRWKAVPGTFQ
jgi:hypothetical protein